MPKRKKYPKLPNGYGSIKYLGNGRRNAYAVHPPVEEFALNGSPITPKAICYVDSWIKGFTVLTSYKAGTYYPGYEKTLELINNEDTASVETLAQRILADYSRIKGVEVDEKGKTFAEVYEDFYKWKFETDKSKNYSQSTKNNTRAAYKNCAALHDKEFRSLRHDDLQKVIDDCKLKHASLELIVSLMHQMYSYAEIYELCDKDYSAHVKINIEDDDEHGVPFSDDELKVLWNNKSDPVVEMILIMCYSGYRIAAYKTMEVNLTDGYFQGGVKTQTSKNRFVPIHSAIFPLVKNRIADFGSILPTTVQQFRRQMYGVLPTLKLSNHTPHDCRHTFSRLCEQYGVNENDRKRLLGHSFGADITNGIYGHRTVDELRKEIERIKVCY